MITAKNLKKSLKKVPDDAKIYAYEGESTGIVVIINDEKFFFINASSDDDEDIQTNET